MCDSIMSKRQCIYLNYKVLSFSLRPVMLAGWASVTVFILPGISVATDKSRSGVRNSTRKPMWAQHWRPTLSEVRLMSKGNCARKSRGWNQTARFCHQEVCQGSTNQERLKKKKNHSLYTQWWLLKFYSRKWWSSGCWLWSQRACYWRHSWSPL